MPGEPITRSDLTAARNEVTEAVKELRADVKAGFEHINDQFDIVDQHFERINGRLRTTEVDSAQHGVQLKNLEREVFDRNMKSATVTLVPPPRVEDETKPITRRDVWLAGSALGVGLAFKVGPWLWSVLKP